MSVLPNISINYGNGALGNRVASDDGLLCLAVCGATAVVDTFALAKHYSIRKLQDLLALGVDEANNKLLYNTVKDFYGEAAAGTQLYVVGYPSTLKMSDVLNKENPYLRKVIELTNGELRGLVVTSTLGETGTVENALDADLPTAMLNAQALGEWARTERYAPLFTVLDGLRWTGESEELVDLKTMSYNRVAVVLGASRVKSLNQAVGLVAARIAMSSVDHNIGRVADDAVRANIYAGNNSIDGVDIESIYAKGYITFRKYTGIAGYFITDDNTATKATDDYGHLTALRTIDKAARIVYGELVQKLLDKVEVRSDGTMLKPVIVSWEQIIKNAITSNMTALGELSDDGDGGVQVFIDPEQDVLASSTINIEVRVRPFGYARYIKVLLGFTINK